MSTQRILFAVLVATLYLCVGACGDDSKKESTNLRSINARPAAVFPNQKITIYHGNSMTLRMLNRYDSLSSCVATLPSGRQFDALNDKAEDISSFDQCGVIVHAVSDDHTGTWQLEATTGEDANYYGTFSVEVLPRNSTPAEPVVFRFERGTSASVRVGPSSATSCRFKNPLGEKLPLLEGNCQTDIASVNEAHQGVWTVSYSLKGGMTFFEEKFQIFIYDVIPSFHSSVTTSDNGQVNLLCTVNATSASLCQFITPYGNILDVVDGVGNDRYIQYGKGLESYSVNVTQVRECGLTILKPKYSDYGSWRCIITTNTGLTGSILKVTSPENTEYISLMPENYEVYAMKGNSFELKCRVNEILKNCWMVSPSGKTYLVSKGGSSSVSLRYTGMGLSLGECGAVIPVSEDAHYGIWQCRVELSDGQKYIARMDVFVTDSVLVPVNRTTTAFQGRIYLSCYVPEKLGYSIDSCQWVGPTGSVIEYPGNLRYILHQERRTCYLKIKYIKESYDVGKWTCMANLVGSTETVSASIEVLATENPS